MTSDVKRVVRDVLMRNGGRAVSSYDASKGKRDNYAPANSNPLQILASFGNPVFDAQFDLNVQIKYFTMSAGAFTGVAASAIAAALKTKLAAFFFGHTDSKTGFAKLQGQYPLSGGWVMGEPIVYGRDYGRAQFSGVYTAFDTNVQAVCQKGDLLIPFTAVTAGPVNTLGLVIIRSSSVPYGDLLEALSSDIFYTNMIRYTIDDTLIAQFNNAIGIYNLSLFGKFDSDTINPNAFKNPDQNQKGILDIPAVKGIDKNIGWAMYLNYDAVDLTLQMFANGVDKLKAA